ncbi:hypothetical protein ACQKWADRAFT_307607 [Trichoderma austrokoningii]
MALATAADIRRVAERVRADAEVVPPYERREPYDFEIFEPLMKMLPKERVPFDPPPRRSDETEREYYTVCRNHYNLWLLQYINDYFKVKDGRLPSPSSDIDDDDDVRAESALYHQRRLLRGMDIVEWDFFRKPAVYESEYTVRREFWDKLLRAGKEEKMELWDKLTEETNAFQSGKRDLTYILPTPQSPRRSSRNIWRSIEDSAGSAAEQQEMDGSVLIPSIERSPERSLSENPVISSSAEQSHERPRSGNEMEAPRASLPQKAEPIEIRKRRRLPAEDSALELPSKKQRTDKHPQLSTALNTAGYKRKRDVDEPLDKPSSTGERGQPSDKKRRLDEEWKTRTSQKRKRGSQQNDEELRVSQPGSEVSETKRRRVSKAEVTKAEQSIQDASTTAGSRRTLATTPSPRITRARRQQLSGDDAQLLQLDQRGKPDVQKPKHTAQEPARKLPATNRNSRQPKKTTSKDVRNSRKTKNSHHHKDQHEGIPPTMASTTVNTTTKTIARTRSRSASSNIRSKGRLSST